MEGWQTALIAIGVLLLLGGISFCIWYFTTSTDSTEVTKVDTDASFTRIEAGQAIRLNVETTGSPEAVIAVELLRRGKPFMQLDWIDVGSTNHTEVRLPEGVFIRRASLKFRTNGVYWISQEFDIYPPYTLAQGSSSLTWQAESPLVVRLIIAMECTGFYYWLNDTGLAQKVTFKPLGDGAKYYPQGSGWHAYDVEIPAWTEGYVNSLTLQADGGENQDTFNLTFPVELDLSSLVQLKATSADLSDQGNSFTITALEDATDDLPVIQQLQSGSYVSVGSPQLTLDSSGSQVLQGITVYNYSYSFVAADLGTDLYVLWHGKRIHFSGLKPLKLATVTKGTQNFQWWRFHIDYPDSLDTSAGFTVTGSTPIRNVSHTNTRLSVDLFITESAGDTILFQATNQALNAISEFSYTLPSEVGVQYFRPYDYTIDVGLGLNGYFEMLVGPNAQVQILERRMNGIINNLPSPARTYTYASEVAGTTTCVHTLGIYDPVDTTGNGGDLGLTQTITMRTHLFVAPQSFDGIDIPNVTVLPAYKLTIPESVWMYPTATVTFLDPYTDEPAPRQRGAFNTAPNRRWLVWFSRVLNTVDTIHVRFSLGDFSEDMTVPIRRTGLGRPGIWYTYMPWRLGTLQVYGDKPDTNINPPTPFKTYTTPYADENSTSQLAYFAPLEWDTSRTYSSRGLPMFTQDMDEYDARYLVYLHTNEGSGLLSITSPSEEGLSDAFHSNGAFNEEFLTLRSLETPLTETYLSQFDTQVKGTTAFTLTPQGDRVRLFPDSIRRLDLGIFADVPGQRFWVQGDYQQIHRNHRWAMSPTPLTSFPGRVAGLETPRRLSEHAMQMFENQGVVGWSSADASEFIFSNRDTISRQIAMGYWGFCVMHTGTLMVLEGQGATILITAVYRDRNPVTTVILWDLALLDGTPNVMIGAVDNAEEKTVEFVLGTDGSSTQMVGFRFNYGMEGTIPDAVLAASGTIGGNASTSPGLAGYTRPTEWQQASGPDPWSAPGYFVYHQGGQMVTQPLNTSIIATPEYRDFGTMGTITHSGTSNGYYWFMVGSTVYAYSPIAAAMPFTVCNHIQTSDASKILVHLESPNSGFVVRVDALFPSFQVWKSDHIKASIELPNANAPIDNAYLVGHDLYLLGESRIYRYHIRV